MSATENLEALADASALVAALTRVNDRRWLAGKPPIDEGPALAELEDRCRALVGAERRRTLTDRLRTASGL